MEKIVSLFEKLKSNQVSFGFEELVPYTKRETWDALKSTEKKLLSRLFVAWGEMQLNQGDPQALESFKLAEEVSPYTTEVYLEQAKAYLAQKCNMKCLDMAQEAIQKALSLDSNSFLAWGLWGLTLAHQGELRSDPSILIEASEKLMHARSLLSSQEVEDRKQKEASLAWGMGRCYLSQGILSGEAIDFRQAIEEFQVAKEFEGKNPTFLVDFAQAYSHLAELVENCAMSQEAYLLYNKAAALSPNEFRSWLGFANSAATLFEHFGEAEYFQQANEAFQKAARLELEHAPLWLKWADLLVLESKLTQNTENLRNSFPKFEKAIHSDPTCSKAYNLYAEALLLYGVSKEDLSLMREAEKVILKSLDLNREDPQAWGIYGTCLSELGEYFEDEKYYLQAIEKFHYGIGLKQNDPLLWYGAALNYFALGDLKEDFSLIEKSLRCFCRVVEFSPTLFKSFWNDWGVALFRLGEMIGCQGHVEEALKKFEYAIGWNPQEELIEEGVELEWLYNYGLALNFLGDVTANPTYFEKAIYILSRAVKKDPNHTPARLHLALSLAHLGELTSEMECFHRASEHFEKAISQDNEDGLAWSEWGGVLINLGELLFEPFRPEVSQLLYERAEKCLLRAVMLGYEDAFYELACLNALLNQFDASIYYLQRAELSGTLPHMEELEEDDRLDNVRHHQEFQAFLSRLKNQGF